MAALDSILFKDVTDIKIGTNYIYKIVRKGYYPALAVAYGPSLDLAATRQWVKDNSQPGRRLKIIGDLTDGYYVYKSDWVSNDNTVLWRRIVDMSVSVSYTAGNNYFDLVFTKPDATQCTIKYHTGDSQWKTYTGTISATGCRFSAESTTSFYIAISHPRYNTRYVNYKLTKTQEPARCVIGGATAVSPGTTEDGAIQWAYANGANWIFYPGRGNYPTYASGILGLMNEGLHYWTAHLCPYYWTSASETWSGESL